MDSFAVGLAIRRTMQENNRIASCFWISAIRFHGITGVAFGTFIPSETSVEVVSGNFGLSLSLQLS